jgi:hypothetical protein
MEGKSVIVAEDMFCRVDRRVQDGEKLEGQLFLLWKHLKYILSCLCHRKMEFIMAIAHLEDYLRFGVEDNKDIWALENLEQWCIKVDQLDEAQRVRHWRIRNTLMLLEDAESEATED